MTGSEGIRLKLKATGSDMTKNEEIRTESNMM